MINKLFILFVMVMLTSCVNNSLIYKREVSHITEKFLLETLKQCYLKHVELKSPIIKSSSLLPIKELYGPILYVTTTANLNSIISFTGSSENRVKAKNGKIDVSNKPTNAYSMRCTLNKYTGLIDSTSYQLGFERGTWKSDNGLKKEDSDYDFDKEKISIVYYLDFDVFLNYIDP